MWLNSHRLLDHCHYPNQLVSAALIDLEFQLEMELFDRVGKYLIANEYGRLLYPKVLALLEQAAEVEQISKKLRCSVKLAASMTIVNLYIAR